MKKWLVRNTDNSLAMKLKTETGLDRAEVWLRTVSPSDLPGEEPTD